MNPSSFTGSRTTEDSKNFIKELKKVFDVIHAADTGRFDLATYQVNNVARTWFDQWKEVDLKHAPSVRWTYFEKAFLGLFFP